MRKTPPPSMQHLLEVMAALREPGGCPWDREQTHRTLLPYLIEEAYELIDAVEEDSDEALREELGDVLLQVVFHARIAEERGAFSFSDVAASLADKLKARHPHVFSGDSLDTAEEVSRIWHRRKMASRRSALDGVPSGQPALQWAFQIGARAARSGFEWENEQEIEGKIMEELREFREAREGDGDGGAREKTETEFGDLLFAMVQLARWQGLDPERCLRASTRKFIARFQWMEEALAARKLRPEEQSAEQWWNLWREAKIRSE